MSAHMNTQDLAERLGVTEHAVALCHDAELVDLHLDSFIPPRLYGYDLFKRHERTIVPGGRFFGHLDVPRMLEGGLSAGMWSITTNPFRPKGGRLRVFEKNLARFRDLVERSEGRMAFARDVREYREVRARGAHAVLLAVQGGNAFEAAPDQGPAVVPDRLLTRVTVVHLTNACYGASSAPVSRLRSARGLTDLGRTFVQQLDAERVFVDLAHIHPDGFWDAVEVHDPSRPLIVTHSGVDGVKPHWRNLDDRQIRAVADSGGVVGVMFHRGFLCRPGGPKDGRAVVEHLDHLIDVGGEGCVAIGTDFDGAVNPPTDLRSADAYPRLVQHMLDAGWSDDRVRKCLGENFLRSWAALRPDRT